MKVNGVKRANGVARLPSRSSYRANLVNEPPAPAPPPAAAPVKRAWWEFPYWLAVLIALVLSAIASGMYFSFDRGYVEGRDQALKQISSVQAAWEDCREGGGAALHVFESPEGYLDIFCAAGGETD